MCQIKLFELSSNITGAHVAGYREKIEIDFFSTTLSGNTGVIITKGTLKTMISLKRSEANKTV